MTHPDPDESRRLAVILERPELASLPPDAALSMARMIDQMEQYVALVLDTPSRPAEPRVTAQQIIDAAVRLATPLDVPSPLGYAAPLTVAEQRALKRQQRAIAGLRHAAVPSPDEYGPSVNADAAERST